MGDCRQGGNGRPWLYGGAPTCAPEPILHPAWLHFISYCNELGHGEIERLKIQDGLPMIAELAIKKIKFAP